MAPKKSAPAHLVITGKVIGPPKLRRDGSVLVVKKTLDKGATRVQGKQQQQQLQLIPAEDVLRTIEDAVLAVARAARGEGARKVKAIQELAIKFGDEQERKVKKEQARTRYQKGKTAAAKTAAGALRRQAKEARADACGDVLRGIHRTPREQATDHRRRRGVKSNSDERAASWRR
jgi:hypothetical protein